MNKVMLIGNLTRDVEKRETETGKTVANFSIAVGRTFSDETDFFNVTVWEKQAENCAKYLKKGSKVGIVGTLQNRSYKANDCVKRTITEVIAEQVEFLSPKQAEETQEQVASVTRERPQLEEIDDNHLPF